MSYKNLQYKRVKKLIEKNKIFNNDNGNGEFRNRHYEFVLSNSKNNLPILSLLRFFFFIIFTPN